ncbi:MAG: response regulator [Candidatus Sumerlaeota bacterium]|nr:response regulator [Candidatus Sumerlaeota bacterium]
MAARILVVEDSCEIQEIVRMTLEFGGYEVVCAGNGREGLDALQAQGPFHLVLTDLDMPVMNGVDFIRFCRADHDAKIPILVLTAEIPELIEKAVAAGANKVIPKPFEPIQLMGDIARFARNP